MYYDCSYLQQLCIILDIEYINENSDESCDTSKCCNYGAVYICVCVCILTRLVKETLMQIYSDEHFADILDYSN